MPQARGSTINHHFIIQKENLMKRRNFLWGCLGLFIIIAAVGGYFIYRFGQQVNLTGFIGQGAVAEVAVPEGFAVTVFAEGLSGPRFMAVGPEGDLYVADRGNDRIVALPDADGDGAADNIRLVAADIPNPHSLVYHEGNWYVGITSGVIRLTDRDGDGVADERTTIIDNLPTSGSHSTRTVAFLPDGRMVVSIGSSCNVCNEEDERRAAVLVYDDANGTNGRLFATGLRNAVGLAIQPSTGQLWASNNGRDLMGDDTPPETVYIVQEGQDYGWPVCHSGRIVDPDLGNANSCQGVEPPVVEMQAHSAPLGLTFYDGEQFPAAYQGDLFIAFHGSWNRSVPTGYKVVRLDMENGQPAATQVTDFATGWLNSNTQEAFGRPVDVTVGTDGSLYVSDDKGGIIYRISYQG